MRRVSSDFRPRWMGCRKCLRMAILVGMLASATTRVFGQRTEGAPYPSHRSWAGYQEKSWLQPSRLDNLWHVQSGAAGTSRLEPFGPPSQLDHASTPLAYALGPSSDFTQPMLAAPTLVAVPMRLPPVADYGSLNRSHVFSEFQPQAASPFALAGTAHYRFVQESNEENEESEQDEDRATRPSGEGQDSQDNRRLGEAPEDNTQSFLRSATVLLEPGHYQFDVGLEYSFFDTNSLVPVDDSFVLERVRQRQWTVPLAVRYGYSKKIQLLASVPVGASLLESSSPSAGDTTSVFGMGDVQAGFLYLVHEQDDCAPDIIFGSSFTAPTGADPFHPGQVAYLGSGFWTVESHVMLIRTIEPVVLLGGVGYEHSFEAVHLGSRIQPGETINYQLGTGFSVNETLTLSAILQGSFQTPTEADGVRLPQTSLEPISLRFALTDYINEHKIIEPFTRVGLTADAPQAELGIVTTYTR